MKAIFIYKFQKISIIIIVSIKYNINDFYRLIQIMNLQSLQARVKLYQNVARAKQTMKFFKTGAGQYAQGDIFVGLSNPNCRQIASNYQELDMDSIKILLNSPIHQERMIALFIMDHKLKDKDNQDIIYKLYVSNLKNINNWDLVDLSAPKIVGNYLLQKCNHFGQIKQNHDPRHIIYDWATSASLWQRRISIISTLSFIRANHFYDTLKISKILLSDKHDLIHKAVGWMLRQVGKRNQPLQEQFIKDNYTNMPRTTLRYAIQKFPQVKRKQFLKGQF